MKQRYKTELITQKEAGSKWGMMDNVKLSNQLELLLNEYDAEGYSLLRLDWIASASGVPNVMLIFERYDYDLDELGQMNMDDE